MMTKDEAIAALVERDVARWGEAEREASRRLRGQLSHGRALNTLAYYDWAHPDEALAADAALVLTDADYRALEQGG